MNVSDLINQTVKLIRDYAVERTKFTCIEFTCTLSLLAIQLTLNDLVDVGKASTVEGGSGTGQTMAQTE